MQIVIDIPDDFYNGVKVVTEESEDITEEVVTLPMECIANGTPLPKGHGDLVDRNDLSLMTVHIIDGVFICDAPTIIEADKAESEVEK